MNTNNLPPGLKLLREIFGCEIVAKHDNVYFVVLNCSPFTEMGYNGVTAGQSAVLQILNEKFGIPCAPSNYPDENGEITGRAILISSDYAENPEAIRRMQDFVKIHSIDEMDVITGRDELVQKKKEDMEAAQIKKDRKRVAAVTVFEKLGAARWIDQPHMDTDTNTNQTHFRTTRPVKDAPQICMVFDLICGDVPIKTGEEMPKPTFPWVDKGYASLPLEFATPENLAKIATLKNLKDALEPAP